MSLSNLPSQMIAPKISRLSLPWVSQSFQHFFFFFFNTSSHLWRLTCPYVFISLEDNLELKHLWLFDNGLVQLTRPRMFLSSIQAHLLTFPFPAFPFYAPAMLHFILFSLLGFDSRLLCMLTPLPSVLFPSLSPVPSLPSKISDTAVANKMYSTKSGLKKLFFLKGQCIL